MAVMAVMLFSAFTMKGKEKPVYMFGVGASFKDSVVYFTEVQVVDSVQLDHDGFLPHRESYAYQMKNYLEYHTVSECIQAVEKLIKNPDELFEMKKQNYMYYNSYYQLLKSPAGIKYSRAFIGCEYVLVIFCCHKEKCFRVFAYRAYFY